MIAFDINRKTVICLKTLSGCRNSLQFSNNRKFSDIPIKRSCPRFRRKKENEKIKSSSERKTE